MKFKYYLRGFGTGVLFATVILMVALGIKRNQPDHQMKTSKETGSSIIKHSEETTEPEEDHKETKIKEETDAKEETDTKKETDAKKETDVKNADKQTEKTDEKNSEDIRETTEKDNTETEKITEKTTKKQEETSQQQTTVQEETTVQEKQPSTEPLSEPSSQTVVITIQPGMNSRDAAELLKTVGLVESAWDFDEYMQQNGYQSKLRIGVYEIRKGASFEEMANTITGN